ncbi:MAG: hypothetical protein H7Z43_09040 [Clostridia bacterium]|nr:hypothetical protein [Deltaproteobacteria bacterium]
MMRLRQQPLGFVLLFVVSCGHVRFRERPEWVNDEPLPIVKANEACRGALVSVDTVSLESPLDGSRHTDDARRALEVALNESGYALTEGSERAVRMRVTYTAKYKDFARDNWADNCCAQMWAICATAQLAHDDRVLEDMTVCDDNVDVRDVAEVGMERIAAKLVAALSQDASAKAILTYKPLPLVPDTSSEP